MALDDIPAPRPRGSGRGRVCIMDHEQQSRAMEQWCCNGPVMRAVEQGDGAMGNGWSSRATQDGEAMRPSGTDFVGQSGLCIVGRRSALGEQQRLMCAPSRTSDYWNRWVARSAVYGGNGMQLSELSFCEIERMGASDLSDNTRRATMFWSRIC